MSRFLFVFIVFLFPQVAHSETCESSTGNIKVIKSQEDAIRWLLSTKYNEQQFRLKYGDVKDHLLNDTYVEFLKNVGCAMHISSIKKLEKSIPQIRKQIKDEQLLKGGLLSKSDYVSLYGIEDYKRALGVPPASNQVSRVSLKIKKIDKKELLDLCIKNKPDVQIFSSNENHQIKITSGVLVYTEGSCVLRSYQ